MKGVKNKAIIVIRTGVRILLLLLGKYCGGSLPTVLVLVVLVLVLVVLVLVPLVVLVLIPLVVLPSTSSTSC